MTGAHRAYRRQAKKVTVARERIRMSRKRPGREGRLVRTEQPRKALVRRKSTALISKLLKDETEAGRAVLHIGEKRG